MERKKLLRFLTLDEVCEILRVSRAKLHAERRSGRLKVLRWGRILRVSERELNRYLARGERASREKCV